MVAVSIEKVFQAAWDVKSTRAVTGAKVKLAN